MNQNIKRNLISLQSIVRPDNSLVWQHRINNDKEIKDKRKSQFDSLFAAISLRTADDNE